MFKRISMVLFLVGAIAGAQEYAWTPLDTTNLEEIAKRASELSKEIIPNYAHPNKQDEHDTLFRLHIAMKQYELSNKYLDSIRDSYRKQKLGFADVIGIHYRISNTTKLQAQKTGKSFASHFKEVFSSTTKTLNKESINYLDYYFTNDIEELHADLSSFIEKLNKQNSISKSNAIAFVQKYVTCETYKDLGTLAKPLIEKIENQFYTIQDSLLINSLDGSKISALVLKSAEETKKRPTILMFSIYPDSYDLTQAKEMVNAGYNGVIAFTRGKKNSPNDTFPFEYDNKDVNQVIDWISKQQWSDGQVGMYGGSYLGFTQWSAVKNVHPALKTIVPQVAVGTGIDYPMHNGIFMSYMLRWIQFVTNTKLTDRKSFLNSEKWKNTYLQWYRSGRSFRALDSIEGTPNLIFQKWLNHPDFDHYWKKMTVAEDEFSNVDIPVLTFTGYYDDDQIGALYYYKEHHKYHKNPDHHLVIGPYDHGGAQGYPKANLNGYKIDPVAQIGIQDMTFQWFDHIMKDSIKPSFLKNKVNVQVMGKNKWKHVSSLDKVSNDTLRLYLDNTRKLGYFKLLDTIEHTKEFIRYEVDFAERSNFHENFDYEELKIVDSTVSIGKQLAFASAPFTSNFELNGQFTGKLKLSLNKKDVDIRILLYEIKTDGTYFNLSNYLGRASYSKDRRKRMLLRPDTKEEVTIQNSTFTSKLIAKGSRLLVLLSVNNNPHWQVNYGSGKDVSDETIQDASAPLNIKWYTDSYLDFPIFKD